MKEIILDSNDNSISETKNASAVIYPSLLTRVKASTIDLVFVLIIFLITSNILGSMDHPPVWLKVVIFFIMVVVYEPLLTTLGCTVGQLLMGIRVRDIE